MAAADCRAVAAIGLAVLAAACSNLPYSPCPIEFDGPLPEDAFVRARQVLAARYGALAVVDATAFRLQTDWVAADDRNGQRRVTVFRDAGGLGLVVELRPLLEPLVGLPYWGEVRGDPAAERQLAGLLQRALTPTSR